MAVLEDAARQMLDSEECDAVIRHIKSVSIFINKTLYGGFYMKKKNKKNKMDHVRTCLNLVEIISSPEHDELL